MGEVESSYDGLVLGLVVGGLEPKSERILDIYSFWRGQNQPGTTPLGIGGPIYGQLPNGEVRLRLSIPGKLCQGEFHDEVCQDAFIAVFGLYMMSNSFSSISHVINLPDVSGLCSTCFIGYSVGISMVCAWK